MSGMPRSPGRGSTWPGDAQMAGLGHTHQWNRRAREWWRGLRGRVLGIRERSRSLWVEKVIPPPSFLSPPRTFRNRDTEEWGQTLHLGSVLLCLFCSSVAAPWEEDTRQPAL